MLFSKRRTVALVCLLGLCGLLSADAFAHQKGKGKGKPDKAKAKSERDSGIEVEFALEFLVNFSSSEGHRLAKENKLTGQKPLPPGIRKNLARGKPLPPGIAAFLSTTTTIELPVLR